METPGADSHLPSPSRGAGAIVSPVAVRKQLGTPGSVSRGVSRAVSMRPQDARTVYFDPADKLPSNDKPVVPGSEKAAAEEAMRYRQRWLFTPAVVLSAVDSEPGVTLIRTKDMQVHRVKTEKLRNVNAQAIEGVPDAMSLSDLSEASLLHTLRERYTRDEVYTRVGPVLMSINPYKWIRGLYTESAMMSYHGKASVAEASELAPHLFGVADHAYTQLVTGQLEASGESGEDVVGLGGGLNGGKSANQSIIISGESGSGKTEATKIIMQYLARITSSAPEEASSSQKSESTSLSSKALGGGGSLNVGELEERVLSCNPLLESFGNAQTLKNDNSSRFGKFIMIQFDKQGRITGAQIQNYLLEKTRIVNQAKRERSYHVFYQLLAGAPSKFKQTLKLEQGVAGFECLKGSRATAHDAEEFEVTKACLVKIGINEVRQDGIFRLLAAVLHLLNIIFVSANEGEGCEVKKASRSSLDLAANLLGVPSADLEKALVSKTMAVHRASTTMLQTKEQARDKAAALGKALYSQLFLWLVAKLNTTIAAPYSAWGFIGVLDIYGFEHFNTNSLEQLLINYANEQLQRHFNQHMFEVEQSEYEKEQIDWSYIQFNDNKACLELIDGRPGGKSGVLAALDDIQRFKGGEANVQFLSQLKNNFAAPTTGSGGTGIRKKTGVANLAASPRAGGGHPHFFVPRFDENGSFGVRHYAGDVIYNIKSFNEKNRENLSADIKTLMASSSNPLVGEVFDVGAQDEDADDEDEDATMSRSRAGGRIREASVGAQFKLSLAGLIATISSTHPRYIRCVKPNPDKEKDRLDAYEVLRQLQYSGMMETIRIRRQGYALRELHDDFFRKYSVLEPRAMDVDELVAMLSKRLSVSQEEWQIGISKVFLRSEMADKLNLLVDLRRKGAARVIQQWIRHTRRLALVRQVLQPFLSKSVVRLKYLRAARHFREVYLRRRMSRKLVEWYRTRKQRKLFLRMRNAAIVIQACARRRHDVIQLKLRKEMRYTPVDELFVSLEQLRSDLDEAVKNNDFTACRSLNSRIHHMTILVTERGAEAERRKLSENPKGNPPGGLTREEIEVRLLEVGWRLEDAEAEQDYALCNKLQREMKELEELREMNPTLPELREKAEKTKKDVEEYAAKADYAEAGRLQGELAKMEERIKSMEEEAAKADGQDGPVQGKFSEKSPKELEELSSKSEEELEAAKAKKNFVKCMELQARITELKAAIEAMPTLQHVEEEVLAAEAEMATAKARKDYRRAAELTVKLPAMQERHSAMALAARKAMSRKQLAEEIQRLEGEMRLAKAEKRYNRCSLLQKNLDELNAIIEELPTSEEIEEQISALRLKMNEAVTQQKYAVAEEYRVKMKELQEEKALAIEKESSKDPAKARPKRDSIDRPPSRQQSVSLSPTPRARDVESAPSTPQSPEAKQVGIASPVLSTSASPAIVMAAQPGRNSPRAAGMQGSRAPGGPVKDDRSVSRLRPKPPVTLSEDASVQDLCVALSQARNDAALLTGASGRMSGIITAIDLTRRVVAAGLNPKITPVREVMTANPTTVRSDGGAMEALGIMIDRHFRHLPVMSPTGEVTGVLDIAKCLYDAVSRLERASEKGDGGGPDGASSSLQKSVLAQISQAKGNRGQAAMAALLSEIFKSDGEPSTLRELLMQKGQAELVHKGETVRSASRAIARGRKAVLVVEDGRLVGIFTEKDLLNRVLAKGFDPDHCAVSDMMTPNPDTVPASMTVLAALQEMHHNKYLHLPVVDDDNGMVLGVVGVMEIMLAIAGDQDSSGWKALFGSALDAGDDFSESASVASLGVPSSFGSFRQGVAPASVRAPVSAAVPSVSTPSLKDSARGSFKRMDARPVSVLRPKPPLCLSSELTLFEVAKRMTEVRTDAAILLNADGFVAGIITDHDITRRVVAMKLHPATTYVAEVMTPNPTMVNVDDSAMECLGIMIERRFRHLPVLDRKGKISGLLSIAKCLQDAIDRLERKAARAEEKSAKSGDNVELAATLLQAASATKKRGKAKAKDLSAVLSMLMSEMQNEGETEPTVGSVLAEQAPSFVDERESVTATANAIAKGRKAVLVLSGGKLAGIVTPKDVMNRVVSKGLDPDRVAVTTIMTPNPDTVRPDVTALDALREMHENKYLHLPVVDEDQGGLVVGVVNVVELVQATVGSRGSSRWNAFFETAMDAADDASDTASIYSIDNRSLRSFKTAGGASSRRQTVGVGRMGTPSIAGSVQGKKMSEHRPVSSLKPKPPLCLPADLTVLQVAKRMASSRTDAVILLGPEGSMKGILTDNDIARKVVGGSLVPSETPVMSVMTPDPLWVNQSDSAMEALGTMIEKHFRHLPVVKEDGAVSGLLNIAKCLYDAIHRLEKKARNAAEEDKGETLAASILEIQSRRGGNKGSAAVAMAELLKGLRDGEAFPLGVRAIRTNPYTPSVYQLGQPEGGLNIAQAYIKNKELERGKDVSDPTLGEVLSKQPSVFVDVDQTAADAGRAIVKTKKAVLVLRQGLLAGIVTPKDLLNRVVAKGLDAESTPLSEVMTPNPDTVPPSMAVLDALKEMHDNKYLHLPVVDQEAGTVQGVVSVMEIIQATAGDRGSQKWEEFFGSAMEAGDDVSDSASVFSVDRSVRSYRSVKPPSVAASRRLTVGVGRTGTPSVSGSVMSRKPSTKDEKPVSKLRLRRPLVMSCDGSVLDVAMEMAQKRTDAALLTKRGRFVGIVTDHDLTRRVIALDKAPDRTAVREIMTPDPPSVDMEESAMKALGLMLEKKTRHLPVMDANGKVVGLLDITKCLYDAIERLERAADKKEQAEGEGDKTGESAAMLGVVLEAAKTMKGRSAKNHRAIQELMMMALSGNGENSREGASLTLDDVLSSKDEAESVRPRDNVREAARVIAAQKKAVLVVEDGNLEGIFTPRDMLNRVIAKRLNPSTTAVSSVMTPNPQGGPPSLSVIEALDQMSENRYLHMPVVEEDTGVVKGVVDVMEIIEATVGDEGSAGWEIFFGNAMDAEDDLSDTMSQGSLRSTTSRRHQALSTGTKSPGLTPSVPGFAVASVPGSSRSTARVGVPEIPIARAPEAVTATVARGDGQRGGDDEPVPIQIAAINDGASEVSRDMGGLDPDDGWDEKFVYKVSDDSGHTYKLKASAEKLESVLVSVADKLKKPKESLLLKYVDDDGDQIVLSGDESLLEAVDMARASSAPALRLVASLKLDTLKEENNEDSSGGAVVKSGAALPTTTLVLIGAGIIGTIAIGLILVMRKKRA